MSVARADRNMQIVPGSLEQREPEGQKAPALADELARVKARIAAAKKLMPAPHEVHCRDCFEKGRDAALRAIEGASE